MTNIFSKDIFNNIGSSPSYYENDPRLFIEEIYPNDEMENQFYDYRIFVKNSVIQIEYWVIDNIFRLQTVTIFGDTDICIWSKYLKLSKEELINLFGTPKVLVDTELHYYREDRKYSVHFFLKNNEVFKIILAGSL